MKCCLITETNLTGMLHVQQDSPASAYKIHTVAPCHLALCCNMWSS